MSFVALVDVSPRPDLSDSRTSPPLGTHVVGMFVILINYIIWRRRSFLEWFVSSIRTQSLITLFFRAVKGSREGFAVPCLEQKRMSRPASRLTRQAKWSQSETHAPISLGRLPRDEDSTYLEICQFSFSFSSICCKTDFRE